MAADDNLTDDLTDDELEAADATVSGVPFASLMAAKRLIIACLETFPEPEDCPEPLRSALARSVGVWQGEVEKVLVGHED